MAVMSRQLEQAADALLPGLDLEAAGRTKPSVPLRQRLQQSWQGRVRTARPAPKIAGKYVEAATATGTAVRGADEV